MVMMVSHSSCYSVDSGDHVLCECGHCFAELSRLSDGSKGRSRGNAFVSQFVYLIHQLDQCAKC